MFNPFGIGGNWYKGNLHTHTDNSDGELSPDEVVEGYKKNNYDFLAITDHLEKIPHQKYQYPYNEVEKYFRENFLFLSGIEIKVDKSSLETPYHLIGINIEEELEVPPKLKVQEGIDFLRKKGGEVILAHPYYSGLTTEKLLSLEGQLGIEVYNSVCLREAGKGLSSVYWDALLAKGKLNWGFAVDDAHFYWSGADAYRGWVMIKAPALNKESVISSIKKGLFYSSCGPKIKEVNLEGKRVYIHTSPVKAINFICDNGKGRSIWNKDGKEFSEAEFELKGEEKYLRIECIEKDGETAWTNPLFLTRIR